MTVLITLFTKVFLYVVWGITTIFLGYIGLWLLFASRRKPKKDRAWKDYQVRETHLATTQDGKQVSIQGVHDWSYSVGREPKEQYKDMLFEISDIEKMYFIIVPFKWRPLAHTFLMFTLKDGSSIGLSVEARRHNDSAGGFWWSKGLFRHHELYYRWGTEGDLVGRRTIYMNLSLYKFPLKISKEFIERLFLVLIRETQKIQETPRFYNTIATNCFTEIMRMMFKVDKKVLPGLALGHFFPGISDKMLIKMGLVDSESTDIDDVRKKFRIDPAQK